MRLLYLLLISCLAAAAQTQPGADAPPLFRNPAINRTHVVFEYANDLWIAPRTGGAASRLTSGPGAETEPLFSPDGTMVAFTGQYDGNVDTFVVPAAGGIPKRLTWHPGPDQAVAWTPDSRNVIFASSRASNSPRYAQFFSVSINGGPETQLPIPVGFEAAYSPDGKRIAYVPMQRAFDVWKRYRGGMTTPIWIADLSTLKVEKAPRDNSNDFCPMWTGNKVWFLSDREGRTTLFSYDPQSKRVARAFENAGADFKSASAASDAIVLEQLGALYLYDLKTSKFAPLKVTVSGDIAEVREKYVRVGNRLSNPAISPTGMRAVFEARGEILTVPAEKGEARNLTNSPGVMERTPAWSPDGKYIAYFSDAAGEYDLHLSTQDGKGEARRIRIEDKPTFYNRPVWSPDSKKLAFTDTHLNLWTLDIDSGKAVKIDKDRFWGRPVSPSWSPDSKWLAYSKTLVNYMGAVFVHNLAEAKSTQVTDGMSDARNPVWDRDGKYLYFTASTDSGPAIQPDIQSGERIATSSIYLIVLSKSDPSPLAPESDEEKIAPPSDEKKPDAPKPDAAKPNGGAAPAAAAKVAGVKIDFDNILQRVLALSMPARRYAALQTGKAGQLFAGEAPVGLGAAGPPGLLIHRFDLKERRSDTPFTGVSFFQLAHNGEKALYRQGQNWIIGAVRPLPPRNAPPAPPAAGGPQPSPLKTAELEVKVNPREEWAQMYRDAWRIQREMFYDPGLHGVNVSDFQAKYRKFLASLSSRRDLSYLMSDMMGEVTVGHLFVFGGPGGQTDVRFVPTGLLGADYELANGRYRFKRIYSGENWNPGLSAPLTQPGVNVNVGDYLLAVDGRNLTSQDNVYSFFEAKSGKQVSIRVGPNPDGSGARDVTVVPTGNEARLRNLAWIEDNRRKVEKATNGRVAYIYMPDTSFGGLTNFNRYFYAQVGKEAAIVDERYNGGGALATDIVELLNRKPMSRVATRDGGDELQPQGAIYGPKVMIINEWAGSGGDAMPWYFRRAGTGPLIGKRTWGGLVGRAGAPQLMDGGIVSAPSSGVWDPASSKWIAENVGIEPDIEVENDPEAVMQGKDPQLEKAIETVMAELAKKPAVEPARPAYPNYQIPGGPPKPNTANATRR